MCIFNNNIKYIIMSEKHISKKIIEDSKKIINELQNVLIINKINEPKYYIIKHLIFYSIF